VGVAMSEQGLSKRFTPEAAAYMEQLLALAVKEMIAAEPATIPLLGRFNGVHIQDSTVVSLPEELAEKWQGCGGSQGQTSAVKIQLDWNYSTGALHRLWLQAGREHDLSQPVEDIELPQGALRITDLGYFKLDRFENDTKMGIFWLSRLKVGTNMYDLNHQQIDLTRWLSTRKDDLIDFPFLLGSRHKIKSRLLAIRVPDKVAEERRRKIKRNARRKGQTVSKARLELANWTLLITNVPTSLLSLLEAIVLYCVRWQIELLFKLWKSIGQLATSRSQNPWRVLCEVYAKLLAMVVQHWIFLIGFWSYPNRSLVKAAKTLKKHAFSLATAFHSFPRLCEVLTTIDRCLAVGCRINSRRSSPNTYQLLLNFSGSVLS